LRHVAQVVAIFVFVLGLAVFATRPAPASAAEATLTETALGDPNAPVTIVEYSSLTCPHCAAFHRETLPQVKTSYIDTGKVRFVYRDFPLGKLALAAAVVGRCVDPSRHFAFIDMLYRDQDTWSQSRDPLAELKLRAQLAGLSDSQVEACLGNKPLIQAVQQRAQEGQQRYGIDSTPSFIVNGKKISGEQSFEAFSRAIDAALAEAG
jgi:protein-disulfide isomerase